MRVEGADQLADDLIASSGSLADVLRQDSDRADALLGRCPDAAEALRLARELLSLAMEERIVRDRLDPCQPELHTYLRLKIGSRSSETVLALLADGQGGFMGEVVIAQGSSSDARVAPGHILREVLKRGAAAFVLAHNHPSGDCRPSESDRTATDRLRGMSADLGIVLLDHLVVTKTAVCAIGRGGKA